MVEVRRQSAAETESWAVRNVRRRAADLSIAFGIFAAVLLAVGQFPFWALAPMIACVSGGLLGGGVYLTADVRRSRQFGKGALLLTGFGVAVIVTVTKWGPAA